MVTDFTHENRRPRTDVLSRSPTSVAPWHLPTSSPRMTKTGAHATKFHSEVDDARLTGKAPRPRARAWLGAASVSAPQDG